MSSVTFAEFQAADRRLAILRALESAAAYTVNALLLGRFLEAVGHAVSADRLAQDLAWLAEQGLLQLADAQGLKVATLTPRGADVATGRATVPGVQRPAPGW
ncbi:MAG: ArsR family transcriptional regulator [Rubrivivax sp.]|nr:ArsR family transcriptional regulator [Rubrivivax sp.]